MRHLLLTGTAGLVLTLSLACGGGEDAPVETPEEEEEEAHEEEEEEEEEEDGIKGAGTKEDPKILECSTKARDLGDDWDSVFVKCPEGCTSGSLWGTCNYTFDSAICVAANHAGALKTDGYPGGMTQAKRADGISQEDGGYKGSKQGDITSNDWASYENSLTFARMSIDECKDGGGGAKKPARGGAGGGGAGGGGRGRKAKQKK